MYKVCTKCHNSKQLDKFNKDKRQRYGRRPDCKLCESRSAGRILKNAKSRLNRKWYKGIKCDLTKSDIEAIPFVCYFCNKSIRSGHHLHRLNHSGDYTADNVVFTHKSCHAKYGGHTQTKNPRKGFGSTGQPSRN